MNMAETKILVVTDKENFDNQIQPHLISLRYLTLTVAFSRSQAIQKAVDFLPDLVLVDTTNIIEWLELSQQLQKLHPIPIIFLTDHTDDEFLKQTNLARPWECLAKPLDARVTHLTINLILHKKKLLMVEQELANLLNANPQAQSITSPELNDPYQKDMVVRHPYLLKAEREQRELAEALRDIGVELSATLNFNSVLDRLLDQVGRVVSYDTGTVFLVEQGFAHVVRTRGHEKLGLEAANAAAALKFDLTTTPNLCWMAEKKEPLVIPDTLSNNNWLKGQEWAHVRSWAGAPIIGQGQIIAFFSLDKIEANFYQPKHAERLAIFASQAGLALENARLFEAEAKRRREAETLREAATALTSVLDLELKTVLSRIAEQMGQIVNATSAYICGLESETMTSTLLAEYFSPAAHFQEVVSELGMTYNLNDEFPEISFALQTNQFGLFHLDDSRLSETLQTHMQQYGFQTMLDIPLQVGGQVIAYAELCDSRKRVFTVEEIALCQSIAQQAAIAIQNVQLYEQAQRHATELEQRVAERTFELEVLYELSQALGQATRLSDVVRLILLYLYRAIPHDVAASLLITDSASTLVIQSQRPLSVSVENNIQEIMCTVLNRPLIGALEIRRIQSKTEAIIRPPLEDLASIMQVSIIIDEVPAGLLFIATEQPNQFTQEQRRLLGIVADQAAASIQRLQFLLAADYQRLENLVAHLPDGVLLLNAERRIVLANQAAQKFLSLLTSAVPGDQLNFLGNQSIDIILSPDLIGLPQEVESISYLRQIFEVVAKPMTAGPEAGDWTLVIRDVTTERAVKERIQQQERLAAVGQLAAGIAHDFNNILTSMIGFAELARTDPHVPPTVGADLQRIVQQGQRAASLIRQVLDFSRQSIAEKRPIQIAPFLKETVKLLERTIPEDIKINLEIEPNSYNTYTFSGDPVQMQQVLANLAVNARDAMPNGGMMHFKLASLVVNPGERPPYPAMSSGYWLALSISDTGAGISPKILPRIFEPFFTTKEVGKGTGLGLAQVYGIITQHEGYIDVQTEFKKGTTFTIYLPATLPLPKEPSQLAEVETMRGHGELILLVEDDLAVLEVTRAMLEHLGYQVITATNGRQGLEIYEQHQDEVALVLTDITMPEMGGIALSQNLQTKYPAIKIVALTGYPLESESKDLLNQGIIDWLQKPLNHRQLAQTINYSLGIDMKNGVRSGAG
jgi:signal transduction histidine kinase/DNA-binding response OmpR family regulator